MLTTVKVIKSSNHLAKDWDYYYHRIESKGVYHCPAYLKTLELHYKYPAELFIFEAGANNFVYYPYFRRSLKTLSFLQEVDGNLGDYFDIESSWYYGGPLIQVDDSKNIQPLIDSFVIAFSKYCRDTGIVSEFIRFDPNLNNHLYFKDIMPLTRNRQSVIVDLKQPEEDIWKNFEGRARTAIRKAVRLGVKVHTSAQIDTDLLKFDEIYKKEMARKNAPLHYHFQFEFFDSLRKTLNQNIDLIFAEVNGTFISAGLFLYEIEAAAHYYLMATEYQHQKYQANSLILYEAALYFKNKGIKIFDLQGGREGVYNFKKSFSKRRGDFYTGGIIHNHKVYKKLVQEREKHADLKDGNFFPLYRIKETN